MYDIAKTIPDRQSCWRRGSWASRQGSCPRRFTCQIVFLIEHSNCESKSLLRCSENLALRMGILKNGYGSGIRKKLAKSRIRKNMLYVLPTLNVFLFHPKPLFFLES